MKLEIVGILGAVFLASCATPHIQLPSVEPIKQAVVIAQGSTKAAQTKITEAQASTTKAQENVKDAQQKIVSLQKELADNKAALTLANAIAQDEDALTEELTTTQTALKDTQTELATTQTNLSAANTRADNVQKTLDKDQKAFDNAAKTEQKYHKLKWGVCFLAAGTTAAVIGFLLFQFWASLAFLGPAALYVAGGAIIGLPTLVFTYLAFKL